MKITTEEFLALFGPFIINTNDPEFRFWFDDPKNPKSWVVRNKNPMGATFIDRIQGAYVEYIMLKRFAEFAKLYTVNNEDCGDFNLSILAGSKFSIYGGNIDTKLTHTDNGISGGIHYNFNRRNAGAFVNKADTYARQRVDCLHVWYKDAKTDGSILVKPLMFAPLDKNGEMIVHEILAFSADIAQHIKNEVFKNVKNIETI